MNEGPAKVLVVAPAWIGDMVMAHTLVDGILARGADVHFLAPEATADLALRMPGVAAVHRYRARHGRLDWRNRRAAAKRMAGEGFEQAIVLPNSLKSALVPFLAGVPRRTGFRGEWRFALLNDMRLLDKARWPRMVDRFAALADAPPAKPQLQADLEARRRLVSEFGLSLDRPVLALCPGAEFGSSKRWPVARFAALAERAVVSGARVWVFGGSKDTPLVAALAERAPVVDLTGRTSLADAVDLLSLADVAVANDSGLMHVAAALDVPVVAIYGSTSPAFTPPLADNAVVVERKLACRPCFQRECPLAHLDCLRGIHADEVFAHVAALGGIDGCGSRTGVGG